ncbi:GerAB/ArcD/ProY family transporter [Niallia sp. NCCP-28]|uniref:GerAB/ArcD/ProY family transporter n=1 Tax=Niallia sp. NCCP-28 TaxID=2934712 RepID=UPI0020854675|nr:GerAB/ArcD/ProY family transporter [Niallia sp. NCCP-28]GKU84449.1 spore germination protein KB [Niallia sp. NCCP-28]
MLTEKLSLIQLLTLIINFLLGSAIVIGVGLEAKRDAWIVVLIGMVIGLLVMLFYFQINYLLPDKNLFEIFEYCFKRPIAICFSALYVTYFIYVSCRVIRDFGELISSAILPLTPTEIVILTLMAVIGYILYMGIEVLGRTSEIFTPYTFAFMGILFIFLYAGGNIQLFNIEPILASKPSVIAHAVIPSVAVFPYGELVAFTVIFSNITDFKYSKLVCLMGVVIASIILATSVFLIIVTLGENTALRSNFPLLSAARLVSIGEFIERIDAIVVFMMMLGILIKSSVFMYGGLKGLEYIFKVPFRYFSIPVTCIISMFSIFISTDFSDHISEGILVSKYLIHLPMEYGIPVFILGILLLKKWKKERSSRKEMNA